MVSFFPYKDFLKFHLFHITVSWNSMEYVNSFKYYNSIIIRKNSYHNLNIQEVETKLSKGEEEEST